MNKSTDDTHEIAPEVWLEIYLAKAPAHIRDAWDTFKRTAHENDMAAAVNYDAYLRMREQYERLLNSGAGV
jgi:hypothetical protein